MKRTQTSKSKSTSTKVPHFDEEQVVSLEDEQKRQLLFDRMTAQATTMASLSVIDVKALATMTIASAKFSNIKCPHCHYEHEDDGDFAENFSESVFNVHTHCDGCGRAFEAATRMTGGGSEIFFTWLCPDQLVDQFELWLEKAKPYIAFLKRLSKAAFITTLIEHRPDIALSALRHARLDESYTPPKDLTVVESIHDYLSAEIKSNYWMDKME